MRTPAAIAGVLALLAARAYAGGPISDIPEIGVHYKVLTVEKSVHRQNLMVMYTKLDEQCRVLLDSKRANAPVLDYYWLMDGTRYKPVHPMLKRGIRKRLNVEAASAAADGRSFTVRLNELDAVAHDLGASPRLTVRARPTAEGCRVEGFITLGPSDHNAVIRLDEIDSEAELTGGFFATVRSIALKGADAATGKPVERVYLAK